MQPSSLALNPTLCWENLHGTKYGACTPARMPDGFVSRPGGAQASLRLVCISDTHSRHEQIRKIPEGDVLVHAGDFTNTGSTEQIRSFLRWFASQPHAQKILIAGNHDTSLHGEYYAQRWDRYHREPSESSVSRAILLENAMGVTYLEDSGCELAGGWRVWGSPWSPEFCNWAFNLDRGEPCAAAWAKIPSETDVLITHGPPLGHGDRCMPLGHRAGCADLLQTVCDRVRPRYHIFGHVHEGYGTTTNGETVFVNASTCTLNYKPTNPPIVVDLPLVRGGGGSEGNEVHSGTGADNVQV